MHPQADGEKYSFSSPHFHVFPYASCVDLSRLLSQPNASWRAPFGSHCIYSVSCTYQWSSLSYPAICLVCSLHVQLTAVRTFVNLSFGSFLFVRASPRHVLRVRSLTNSNISSAPCASLVSFLENTCSTCWFIPYVFL